MIQFNTKVNILRIASSPGAFGQTEVANVLYKNLPCRINWKRGNQKIFFSKDSYFRDAKLFCKIIDVTYKDRVQHNGKTYKIVDVNNLDESSRYMTLDLKLTE